jgi:hypothetical protein
MMVSQAKFAALASGIPTGSQEEDVSDSSDPPLVSL